MFLKDKFQADFVITPAVQNEIIDRPLKVGRFAFTAIRLKHLLNQGILRVVSSPSLKRDAQNILSKANNLFSAGKPLPILQLGEAECLALLKPLQARALLVDEKTTRLLLEDPAKLYSVMRAEKNVVKADEKNLYAFQKEFSSTVMRSTELLGFAAQNGFFNYYSSDKNDVFHSAVYALRYAGCSISEKEIEDYGKIRV